MMKELRQNIVENTYEIKCISACKILAYFGICTNNTFTYSTTYGFSFDSFRGISKSMEDIIDFLNKNDIKYKLSGGSMHKEIKISSKKENLENFVKLGNRCWKEVEKVENKYLIELKKIIEKIDKSSLNSKRPNINSIIHLQDLIDERELNYKKYFHYYNFEKDIEIYKKFLEVSGDINKVKELYYKNKALGLREYDIRLSVLLDSEIERLTGNKIE